MLLFRFTNWARSGKLIHTALLTLLPTGVEAKPRGGKSPLRRSKHVCERRDDPHLLITPPPFGIRRPGLPRDLESHSRASDAIADLNAIVDDPLRRRTASNRHSG